MLARSLDRSSVSYGALAGVAAGLMLAETGPGRVSRMLRTRRLRRGTLATERAPPACAEKSFRPLGACALLATLIAGLPLLLTYLFLEVSNRPGVALSEATRGSLHPASLLTAIVADLFGAFDPTVEYWGPYSRWWDKNELTLSQNMGQVYFGTLPILLLLTAGLIRGALWRREVRVLTIAVILLLLYAFGGYTPVFRFYFYYLPGASFFRRPVDAMFLVGALLAIMTGYVVHLWASGSLPFASHRRRTVEAALIIGTLVGGIATAWVVGKTAVAWKPTAFAFGWIVASSFFLAVPAIWVKRGRRFAVVAPALLLAVDLGVNNGPNEFHGAASVQLRGAKSRYAQRHGSFLEGEGTPIPRITVEGPGRTGRLGF